MVAWKNIFSHYEGNAEGDKRVTVAKHNIKIMVYTNESCVFFEKYSTRLNNVFFILYKYKEPKCKRG